MPQHYKTKNYIKEFEAIGYILQTTLVMLYSWKSIIDLSFYSLVGLSRTFQMFQTKTTEQVKFPKYLHNF